MSQDLRGQAKGLMIKLKKISLVCLILFSPSSRRSQYHPISRAAIITLAHWDEVRVAMITARNIESYIVSVIKSAVQKEGENET